MENLTRILRAVADPTRLRMLNLLLQRNACVCELQSLLALPQPLLSRHFAYLRAAGLVCNRRLGGRVEYSVAPPLSQPTPLRTFLEQVLSNERVCRADLSRWRIATGSGRAPLRPARGTAKDRRP